MVVKNLFLFVTLVSICSVAMSCTWVPVPRLISREHLRESSQREVVQAFRDLTRKPPDKMAVQEDCDKIHSYYIEILSKAPGSPLAYLVFQEIYSFYPATFSAMKKKNSRASTGSIHCAKWRRKIRGRGKWRRGSCWPAHTCAIPSITHYLKMTSRS